MDRQRQPDKRSLARTHGIRLGFVSRVIGGRCARPGFEEVGVSVRAVRGRGIVVAIAERTRTFLSLDLVLPLKTCGPTVQRGDVICFKHSRGGRLPCGRLLALLVACMATVMSTRGRPQLCQGQRAGRLRRLTTCV